MTKPPWTHSPTSSPTQKCCTRRAAPLSSVQTPPNVAPPPASPSGFRIARPPRKMCCSPQKPLIWGPYGRQSTQTRRSSRAYKKSSAWRTRSRRFASFPSDILQRHRHQKINLMPIESIGIDTDRVKRQIGGRMRARHEHIARRRRPYPPMADRRRPQKSAFFLTPHKGNNRRARAFLPS